MNQLSKLVWSTTAALALVVAMGATSPAAAQPKIAAGYQFISLSSGGASTSYPAGWFADVAFPVIPMISVLGSVDGAYKSETVAGLGDTSVKTHTFMGGVRYSLMQLGQMTPFIQASGGIARSSFSLSPANTFVPDSSSSDGVLDIGGGVDWGLLRLGAGYRQIMSTAGANAFRLNVGVVF